MLLRVSFLGGDIARESNFVSALESNMSELLFRKCAGLGWGARRKWSPG